VINPKKKLLNILYQDEFVMFVDEDNKSITNKKLLNDTSILIKNINSKKFNNNIFVPKFKKKYNYILFYFACLFSDKQIFSTNEITKKHYKMYNVIDDIFIEKSKKNILIKNSFSLKNHFFLMLETTGTTSKKKTMIFKSWNYLNACLFSKNILKYVQKSVLVHCLPITYNAGINNLLFSAIFAKSKIILTENFNLFSINKIILKCLKFKVNCIQLMPSMYMMLNIASSLQTKKFIKNCNKIVSTGSYLYEEVNNIFEKNFKKKIKSCYGITELGGALSLSNYRGKLNSVGHLSKKIKFKILKNKILFLNTKFMIDGYVNLQNNKIKKINPKKLINTGDLAIVKKGELFLIGRKREIVKRGGEMISLKEVENVALKFKYISNVCCVPKKNIYSDEDIVMVIELKKKFSDKDKFEFTNFLKENLYKNSFPTKIIYIKDFPYYKNGKLNRHRLLNHIIKTL
jgi:acyl-CoA synthetase (AMP-forming)/AMP-acid ligase II